MYQYEGNVVPLPNGKFYCIILKVASNSPNHDTIKEHEAPSIEEAQNWIDKELERLCASKGIIDDFYS